MSLNCPIYIYVAPCMLIIVLPFCSEKIVTGEVPADMETFVAEKRRELIEVVSEVDDKLGDMFLSDEPISSGDLEVCWKYLAFKKR